ncbi:peptidoglycan DD-metalloendopeptidase family protein [uncultured Polaribacter sp.]|uniref:peptidoglycan DD-metalloendopeptidase family protein n=1 Tax=uncultured Polaribacter sp. TaxID=174711 RepID=UPI0026126335|nr:peptidoglycan DD-metalloendopeptidase family protein [uncultured Polaribacter sp.]
METSTSHKSFKNKFAFTIHPNLTKFNNWVTKNTFSLTSLFPTINKKEIHHVDLSVTSNFIGGKEEFNDLSFFQKKIDSLQKKAPNKIIAGGYLEKRALYTSDIYERESENGFEKRTIHLGLDFWLPEKTPVHAILDGEVICITDDASHKGYGGFIILKHTVKELSFYTLYGHNTIESILKHKIGDVVKKGKQIAILANSKENGDWVPHLHFQIMLTLLDFENDFPGVAFESEIEIWKSICPDPNMLFKLEGFKDN